MNTDYFDIKKENMSNEQLFKEDPNHLKYMHEFRVHQCKRFLEHKCSFHKPFICFDWHFPNQRRRVPIIKLDRTFNYNPDLYCNTYVQNNGKCLNGENCQYVHMNAGDTERRYHPRYFKTGMCIYETTSEGICGKNGIHCAFAHNNNDLRLPILDIRESFSFSNNLSAQLEKERVLAEDPIWNDMDYVLAFYKTIECKKQPKTCRQGYACPFYHNSKDKRRMLNEFSYQSQPCSYLKPNNDEWQDVAFCPNQDQCTFSHSRTEQQFHSEIFKSSKCNDVIKENNCPRGPFCAFAHNDEEINIGQYVTKMQNGFNKYFQLMNFHKLNISNSQCLVLTDSKPQIKKVFQNHKKLSNLILQKSSEPNNSSIIKLFNDTDLYSPEKDLFNSSLLENQSKDISKNLKHILERALSDSSNVSQMSEVEIQKLPELLMRFSNLEELHIDNLPIISEWVNEIDDSDIANKDDFKNRQVDNCQLLESTIVKTETKLVNQDKILLYKEILETKHKLIKVEEDLKNTRYQLNSIFSQLNNFLSWLEKSEIKDSYKKEINLEMSIIIESLGKRSVSLIN